MLIAMHRKHIENVHKYINLCSKCIRKQFDFIPHNIFRFNFTNIQLYF